MIIEQIHSGRDDIYLVKGIQAAAPTPTRRFRDEFERELISHLPSLQLNALRLTRNAAAAAELVQNTYLKAWAGRAHFVPGTYMKSWLKTIMHTTNIDMIRRSQRQVQVVDLSEDDTAGLGFVPASQDKILEFKDVARAYDKLSRKHQNVIASTAYGDSYEDAAEKLQLPLGTVKSTLSRAREALTKHLEAPQPAQIDLPQPKRPILLSLQHARIPASKAKRHAMAA